MSQPGETASDSSSDVSTFDRLTVTDAARRLDISEAALRKRIQRGQVRADRDGPSVWVLLPVQPVSQPLSNSVDEPVANDVQSESNVSNPPALLSHVETLSRQLETAEEDKAFMREELRRRGEELRRRDEQIAALTAAVTAAIMTSRPVPIEATGHEAGTRRPWWRFWER